MTDQRFMAKRIKVLTRALRAVARGVVPPALHADLCEALVEYRDHERRAVKVATRLRRRLA